MERKFINVYCLSILFIQLKSLNKTKKKSSDLEIRNEFKIL